MNKVKNFLQTYSHGALAIIYVIFYLIWFFIIEHTNTTDYRIIHMAMDDKIPFIEIFVIPYFMWFAYIGAVVIFLIFKDKDEFFRAGLFLATGMTVFLIISTLWPNGHHLRPTVMPRDNFFTHLIAGLYKTDTATNLWPSIHVYNSIGAHLAVRNCKQFKNKFGVKLASFILCILIILSTMFIKQHSVFDVLTGIGMAAFMYIIVYRMDAVTLIKQSFGKRKENEKTPVIE